MRFSDLADFFQKIEAMSKRLEMTAILAELFKKVIEDDRKDIGKVVYLCQGRLLPEFKKTEFGISEKLIHKAMVKATGRSSDEIKKFYQETGDYGEVAHALGSKVAKALTISQVYDRLNEIAAFSHEGSVAKKVDFLAKLLNETSPQEAKFLIRIIIGKMRLGVGDPTVLDALSFAYEGTKHLRVKMERAYNLCSDLGLVADILFSEGINSIEDFEVIVGCPIRMALAARLSEPRDIIEKIGMCAVEAKYDGFRCQVHKQGAKVKIYSRNLEDMTDMFPEIKEGTFKQIKEENVIYEGEAIAYDARTGENLPFQNTVQRKRKHDISMMQSRLPLKIFVFDLLYAGADLTKKSYQERRNIMEKIIFNGAVLEISPVEIVNNAERLSDVFEEALAQGREGIVAKRLDGIYQAGGRNFNWIKLKRSYSGSLSDTVDCVIAGYFLGKGTRTEFGIGSLLACVYDKENNTFKTIAKIGSGLTEEELKNFKKMLNGIKLKNKPVNVDSFIEPDVWTTPRFVVEVQADEITRSPVHTCGKKDADSPGYALRFPRTVGFIRSDKRAEDATTVNEIINMFSMQGRKK